MTSIGYGDITPRNTNERLITMLSMIISSMTFAFIIGDIGKVVGNYNILADQFRERMLYVEQFLRQKDIPEQLRKKVRRYLEYILEQKKIYKIEETEVLELLNVNLKGKVEVYLNACVFYNITIFMKFPIEFLSNLNYILQPQIFALNETIIFEEESGRQVYFI